MELYVLNLCSSFDVDHSLTYRPNAKNTFRYVLYLEQCNLADPIN